MLTTTLLIKIAIVLGVLLFGVGGIYLVKKTGSNVINEAASIVAFVKFKLEEYQMGNYKVDIIMDLILQVLTYIQAMSTTTTSIDEKVQNAFDLIIVLLKEAKISTSTDENNIIKSVLKGGFVFMNLIGVSADKVSKKNYMGLYKEITKQSGNDINIIVGMRKSL